MTPEAEARVQAALHPLARALGQALAAVGQAQRRGLGAAPKAGHASPHADCAAQLHTALGELQGCLVAAVEAQDGG